MEARLRNGFIISGFVVLGVVAAFGWLREPRPAAAPYAETVQGLTPAVAGMPATSNTYSGVQPATYRRPAFATTRYVRTVHPANQPPPRSYRARRHVRHGRSLRKSAEIVGGSAAVGAAIGALAGGGRGAAVGALAGGAGGFVYDRMTHNR